MDDDDNWVNLAMSNELLVANLLLHLKHDTLHSPPPLPPLPPQRSTKRASPVLKCWGSVHRARSKKRRSRYSTKRRSNSPKRQDKKGESDPELELFSPETPFSWNSSTCTRDDIAAASGGDDNPVDSSRPKVDDQTAIAKGSRRKGTLSELKEEESLPLKKGTYLKNELASSNHTVEKHGATNESSKKIKLTLKINLASRQIITLGTSSMMSGNDVLHPSQLAQTHCHPSELVPPQLVQDKVLDEAANSSSKQQEISSNQEPLILLPDLNLPLGEDFSSRV